MRFITSEQDFEKFIRFGVSAESSMLDFKGTYGDSADQKDEIRKDVTSFSNTLGGTLLIGVTERIGASGYKVADGVLGNDIERLKSKISDSMATGVYPPVKFQFYPFSVTVGTVSATVLAVCIDAAPHGPVFRWQAQGGALHCFYRDEYGVKTMHPSEISKRSTSSRAAWIKLAHLVPSLPSQLELVGGYYVSMPRGGGGNPRCQGCCRITDA